ncbi:MAG: hypothetical protein IPL00_01640 [Gammaproteobacteria bacterium]|nr:hypothetical protein [Gammaproteobacteria bacterium]
MSVNRILRAYSNETEWVIWELPIEKFSLREFQAEFCVEDPDDPMYECWPVKPENVPFLESRIKNTHGWDFEAASYFVEADAV